MTRQVFSNLHERWIGMLTLILATVLVFGLSASSAWAQATAAINGTVRDSGGAAITDATVVLHNHDTNLGSHNGHKRRGRLYHAERSNRATMT